MFYLNPANLMTKLFAITAKGFGPATYYVRDNDATTAPARTQLSSSLSTIGYPHAIHWSYS